MFSLEPAKKINYIQCPKGGFHDGELLNMVCVQPSCIDDMICCCACIEQDHKKHVTKPIKMLVKEAQEGSGNEKVKSLNTDILYNIIGADKKDAYEAFTTYKYQIIENLNNMEVFFKKYYSVIESQVMQSQNSSSDIKAAMEVLSGPYNVEQLKLWMKKVALNVEAKNESVQMTEGDLIQSIKSSNQTIKTSFIDQMRNSCQNLQTIHKNLREYVNSVNIWNQTSSIHKFSNTFKHSDVLVVNDFKVKSTTSNSYKFITMDPDLQKGQKIVNFKYKITKNPSTWVAVGMCHRNIVKNNSYAFNFGKVGHGAYMVSSNGGTWSNIKDEDNNKVKAFKFGQNDVIAIKVDFNTKKITFTKNNSAGVYTISFGTINGDKLHPCVLFYFADDEVTYLKEE